MSPKTWHFNPYHQRIDEAMQLMNEPPKADTEWILFEVFVREKRGEHPVHVGALHAPDPEMAIVLAKEQYLRRGEAVQLWVVPSACITATPIEDADIFAHTTDKSYREAYGYRVAERVRHLRGEEKHE